MFGSAALGRLCKSGYKSRPFLNQPCPTALPPYRRSRAGNGTRTRDPNLGKVVLYQLSYSRRFTMLRTRRCFYCNGLSQSGGEGNRTPDLVNAIHALSQLSYAPVILDAD